MRFFRFAMKILLVELFIASVRFEETPLTCRIAALVKGVRREALATEQ